MLERRHCGKILKGQELYGKAFRDDARGKEVPPRLGAREDLEGRERSRFVSKWVTPGLLGRKEGRQAGPSSCYPQASEEGFRTLTSGSGQAKEGQREE